MTPAERQAIRSELQAAWVRLKQRQRVVVVLCILAGSAFVVGIAWPSVHVAAALLACAAVTFICAAFSVAWRNRASDDVARCRLDAERDR